MIPPPRYTPLRLPLIDEGRFLAAAEAELMCAQTMLAEYAREHGDAAKKARAKITIEITLQCEDPGSAAFSVRAISKMALPNRPPSVTLVFEGRSESGAPCLFVRRSGSTDDPPAQGVLATKDGRTVDTETGEVLPDPAKT